MTEPAGGASSDYSTGPRASREGFPTLSPLVLGLLFAAVLGGVLLIVAEFSTTIQITVGPGKAVVDTAIGHERHGYSLLIVGLLVFPMVFGAGVGRSRPAMAAIAVLGLAALLVALIGDAPDIHKTGVFGERFEDAQANPKSGYYLETLGAVLVLIGGACSWVLTRVRAAPAAAPEPAAEPSPGRAAPPTPEG
jgi:hypothetical protein